MKVIFLSILIDWERYFQEIHSLKTDFSGIYIPEASDEFSWFICRPENFFAERAFNGGKKLYGRMKLTDESLDSVLDMSFGRDGKTESYVVRVRPNWGADWGAEDEELINLSANQIVEKNINTLCLTERLLLGDFLYWKHKKHLDVYGWTLCPSSRYSYGYVPIVCWNRYYGKMHVHSYGPDHRFDYLRSRQAVS